MGVLLLHGAIVLATTQAALGQVAAPEILLLALAHLVIDTIKTHGRFTGPGAFLTDQAAHLAALAAWAPGLWAAGVHATLLPAPAEALLLHAMTLAAGLILTLRAGDFAIRALIEIHPPQAGATTAPRRTASRASELTLAEFRTLSPKMDAADKSAITPEAYQRGTAPWRTDLYSHGTTLLTHADSIALFDALGADFTPELKAPSIEMPFDGFSQTDYAQKMIDEYKAAGIDPARVWAQSFNLDDILYWIENEPEFGRQAVYLDDRYEASDEDEGLIDPMDAATFKPAMAELKAMGVNYIAPPMWMLVTLDEAGRIVPSVYAREARAAGLNLITWTMERSGPLHSGGGWYFQSITGATDNDGVTYELLHVLAQDVGVIGVFSDWPATTTFYANCMGL